MRVPQSTQQDSAYSTALTCEMTFAKCQAEDRALMERVDISFGDEHLWRKCRFSGKLILRSFTKVTQMKAPECL